MKNFWRGKTVLVTGHTGFKGGWLSLWLSKLNARVIGYSLPPPTEPSLFKAGKIEGSMVSLTGDVRDAKYLQSVIASYKPDILFHLAAQSLVRYAYEHPLETYSTNILGTVNVLEAIRGSADVCAAVMVTSDKCYANHEWVWGYRENDALGGDDPYSSSKGCAELIVHAYRSSYFSGKNHKDRVVPIASVRAGNVVGGGDWARDRLVPDLVKALLENRPPFIRNPEAVRPWQHVLEPLHGYLLLAQRLCEGGTAFAESWNFGPDAGDERPVSWVSDYLTCLWGGGVRCELDVAPHPTEAKFLRLDSSKAKRLLGWKPKLTLPIALEWTVDWYRMYDRGGEMRSVTQEQIARYEELTPAEASFEIDNPGYAYLKAGLR